MCASIRALAQAGIGRAFGPENTKALASGVLAFGPEGAVPDSTQAPLGLLLFWCGLFVFQMLEVEDGVEDQRVAADGFAAVDGVVAEEQHVALA